MRAVARFAALYPSVPNPYLPTERGSWPYGWQVLAAVLAGRQVRPALQL